MPLLGCGIRTIPAKRKFSEKLGGSFSKGQNSQSRQRPQRFPNGFQVGVNEKYKRFSTSFGPLFEELFPPTIWFISLYESVTGQQYEQASSAMFQGFRPKHRPDPFDFNTMRPVLCCSVTGELILLPYKSLYVPPLGNAVVYEVVHPALTRATPPVYSR